MKASVLLIEKKSPDLWRIVARDTTATGLARGAMPEIAVDRSLASARLIVRGIKRHRWIMREFA